MINQANPDYWNDGYKKHQLSFDPENILFKDLFAKYIPRGGNCMEVGCYPGNYLIYFGKYFDYTVNGIDTTPYILERLPGYLSENNVTVDHLYHTDFLNFEGNSQYYLVYSFGFIEYFKDFKSILEKHIRLVKPGGYPVISCPNFRGLQFLLHRILDNENLERHVTQAMDFKAWSDVLTKNDMDLIYQNYYLTAGFWVDTPPTNRFALKILYYILKCVEFLNKFDYPNILTSPHMISISKKRLGKL